MRHSDSGSVPRMAPTRGLCLKSSWTSLFSRNENERLKEQLARTQAALAESEEARQRLETIVVDMRREKFGAKSEKLRPDQFHLPLEDVEIAKGVPDAAQEKAAALIKGKSDPAPCPANR